MPHAPVLTVTLIMGTTNLTPIWITGLPAKNHRESTNMSQKRWTVLQELSMLSSSPIQDIINNFTVLAEIQPQPLHRAEDRAVFFISFPLRGFSSASSQGNGSAAPSNCHRSYFLPSLPATCTIFFGAG